MMTDYKFNPQQHAAKIKAGMQAAKQAGKKLGRPKGGKIKGEDEVKDLYINYINRHISLTIQEISEIAGVSIGTVRKIINKYKKRDGN